MKGQWNDFDGLWCVGADTRLMRRDHSPSSSIVYSA
jgi:hypothetical protein